MTRKHCTGWDEHIHVKELDSKVWHDNDLYSAECSKCGAKVDEQLSRRPTQVFVFCKGVE